MSLNQLLAEFSFSTPSAPPLVYTFKLSRSCLRQFEPRAIPWADKGNHQCYK